MLFLVKGREVPSVFFYSWQHFGGSISPNSATLLVRVCFQIRVLTRTPDKKTFWQLRKAKGMTCCLHIRFARTMPGVGDRISVLCALQYQFPWADQPTPRGAPGDPGQRHYFSCVAPIVAVKATVRKCRTKNESYKTTTPWNREQREEDENKNEQRKRTTTQGQPNTTQ